MWCQSIPASPAHDSTALDVSSVPLSLTTVVGLPRRMTRAASSRATRLPEIDVSTTAARHSRVTSSMTFSTRNRLPLTSWSRAKSSGQRSFGCAVTGSGARAPTRLAPARGQPFLGVEPLRPLAVNPHTFPQQQDVQPPTAKAPTLLGQLAQAPTQTGVAAASRPIPDAFPVRSNDAARPPLAHPEARPEAATASRLAAGVTIFFRAGPSSLRCRAWLRPTAASARRSRRNAKRLRLTSSSPRSRLASDSSNPPHFDFHA